MTKFDPETCDLSALTLWEITKISPAQLEALRRAALAQIAFDTGAPAAARVAALKGLETEKSGTGSGHDPGNPDPADMTLDEINQELGTGT